MATLKRNKNEKHMSVRCDKLDFFIKNAKSVALVGREGVGKTSSCLEAFQRNGLAFGRSERIAHVKDAGVSLPDDVPDDILYDAFQETGGVEKVAYWSASQNNFAGDPYKAKILYFDDLNPSQAQRAAKEVLSLRRWNGLPIAQNATCWACVGIGDNYEDFTWPDKILNYFDGSFEIPYLPYRFWFTQQYGDRVTTVALEWWDALDKDAKDRVSPRKLAQALDMWKLRGDIRDVLPVMVNGSKLAKDLYTSQKTS